MSLMTRILVLSVLSIAGIALLAPLAAQSAEPVLPDAVDDALLTEVESAPRADIARGDLSFRGGAVPSGSAAAEALDPGPMPTPASAPMEATLHSTATPPPAPDPTPVPQPAARAPAPPASAPATYSGDSVWDDLAQCESGGNWSINTGNGYYGGLQFSYGTWHDYGGGAFADYPHQATREEQIVVAERLRDARGYAPWPACRAKLGLP